MGYQSQYNLSLMVWQQAVVRPIGCLAVFGVVVLVERLGWVALVVPVEQELSGFLVDRVG